MRIGEILISSGVIDEAQLHQALGAQLVSGARLGTELVALGFADHDAITDALARQSGVRGARRRYFERADDRTVALVPREVAERLRVFPLGVRPDQDALVVAMRDPADREAVAELAELAGREVHAVIAAEGVIAEYIAARYVGAATAPPIAAAPVALAPPEQAAAPIPASIPEAQVVALPPASTYRGRRRSRSVERARLVKRVGLGLAALAVVVVAWKLLSGDDAAPRWVEVGGEPFHVAHVHMEVMLPVGWRYLPGKDYEQRLGLVKERGSLFYRGGTAELPDEGLVLMLVDSGGTVPEELGEARFRQVLEGIKQASMRSTRGISMAIAACDLRSARGVRTGECTGTASFDGQPRNLLLFVWIESGGYLAGAAFLSREDLALARPGIEQILESVQVARSGPPR
ncbi:MAG TPA: hypothetical protein VML75_25005 [Kofleriaceae bacterium]|nr:hypothetical protein [Kofleriaceae bacterium]